VLQGNGGNDLLNGGAGADTFVFVTALGNGIDTVADFNALDGGAAEGDRFEFRGLQVGTFAWLGTDAFTGGLDHSEARVQGNQLLVDTDGSGVADITITLTGLTNANQLSALDFLWT